MRRKDFILVVIGAIILGALVSREYPRFGFVFSLVVMAFYLMAGMRGVLSCVRRFRSASGRAKVCVGLAVATLLIIITALLGGGISYFLLLVVLAVDYLIYDK